MTVRSSKGFTLAEMLAVIGIMLVLVVATFGVFGLFAQRLGPDSALATLQAMLNGARDYAATNGVLTRISFTATAAKPEDGTTMTLQYKDPGGTDWKAVRGRSPVSLKDRMFVCRDMPTSLPTPPSTASDPRVVSEADVNAWKDHESKMLTALTNFAYPSGLLATTHTEFYAVFDPAGYLRIPNSDPKCPAANCVLYGLTIVQVGGTRVVAYAFYPINSNTGTRVVFD
jgi:prepilin-type N-terminal cleavage/methylation domain-containing protein